jgi:multisubunit Na+/H+ antiporter MnhB subunit
MQIVLWIFMGIALVGSYYNATMRCKLSYILWLFSNLFFVWHNLSIGEIQQGLMYGVYFILAIIGMKNSIHQKGWFRRASMEQ